MYQPALCNGKGTCGKCTVKVLAGYAPVSKADKDFFSEKELQEGFRLSCKCVPTEELLIEVELFTEESMKVLGVLKEKEEYFSLCERALILGIDIGTTTIAMCLADAVNGEILKEYLTVNKQRTYGADVISRIQAAVEGEGDNLQECIRQDLWKGIKALCSTDSVIPNQILIAGNTTMIHLLMGYPCNTLGVAPFLPYNIKRIESDVQEICGIKESNMKKLYPVPVSILPGISAFVGPDIVADLLVCNMTSTDTVNVLIDLGTNGEMAVGNREKILVTSAAAGPAFEGGNITHGIASVPGAICGVEIDLEQGVQLKTIANAPPIGICGTGVIEIIYELLKSGRLDETGYLEEEEVILGQRPEGGNISFFQKDVREFQLAKSAIRAGMETLLFRFGIKPEAVDRVYLAGGFGYHIPVKKAIGIGLFPESFAEKIQPIGNGSLNGALLYGNLRAKEDSRMLTDRIIEKTTLVELATEPVFGELYMKYMYLREGL